MGGSAYAYAAGVNLDSSALKDAGVDCSTTWDGSEFQSPTDRTAKVRQNACVEEPTARNLKYCSAFDNKRISIVQWCVPICTGFF